MTTQMMQVDENQLEEWRMECITMLKNRIIKFIGTKRQKLESIVNQCIDNIKSLKLLKNDDTLKNMKTFKVPDEDIQNLCKYLFNKIESWKGVAIRRCRMRTNMNKQRYERLARNWLDCCVLRTKEMNNFYVKFAKTDLTSYCNQISLQSITSSKKAAYGFIRAIDGRLDSNLIVPIPLYQLIFCYYYQDAKYYYNLVYFQTLFDIFTATKIIPFYSFKRCQDMNDYLTILGAENGIEWTPPK
eukprot:354968_1